MTSIPGALTLASKTITMADGRDMRLDYRDLITTILDQTPISGPGFTAGDMRRINNLSNRVQAADEGAEIVLTKSEVEHLKQVVENFRFAFHHKAFVEFSDAIQAIVDPT